MTLPDDAPEGEAEVIILVAEPTVHPIPAFATLREYNDWLDVRPSGYTPEEIERHIAEERAAWD